MSRSGEIFSRWRTISSPVLTMMVKNLGSITSYRPSRSFEAPTPPASAVIFSFTFEDIENSDAGSVGSVTREAIGICYLRDAIAHARRKKFFPADKLRVESEAFAQGETVGFRFGLQAGDLGPGGFGIDEILGDGRNAAPIVDARIEQTGEIVVAEVWRGLNVHLRAEDEAGERDGAQHVFKRRLRMRGHGNFRLGAEILDDDFLDVAIFFVERSNRQERVDALFHGFADADQDAGGKRDGELPRFFDGAKAQGGDFVWRLGMRQAIAHQARADVFEHEADAGVRIFQTREGRPIHDAGIGMREQASFFENEFAHGSEIVEGA